MELIEIGTQLADVETLVANPDMNWCVRLSSEQEVRIACFHKDIISDGELVFMKPESFTKECRRVIAELVDGADKVQIKTRGSEASERTRLHQVARDLNIKVSVNKKGGEFVVTQFKGELRKRQPPYFLNKLKENIGHPTLVTFKDIPLSSFRAKVYKYAKRNNYRITVVPVENEPNAVLMTLHGNIEDHPNNAEIFRRTVVNIEPGEFIELPVELNGMSENYVRVMCNKYGLSYKGGRIHRPNLTPHIDGHGNFHMDGTNHGQRSKPWITIAMKKAGHTQTEIDEVLK